MTNYVHGWTLTALLHWDLKSNYSMLRIVEFILTLISGSWNSKDIHIHL